MEKTITVDISEMFLEIDNNYALSKRGDYILSYKIEYKPRYTQSEIDLTETKDTWDRAIQGLSIGTIICKSDAYWQRTYNAEYMPQETFLQKSTSNHFQGREYMEHNGYVFFIFPMGDTKKINQIRNPFIFPKEIKTNEADLKIFQSNVKDCVAILNRSEKIMLTALKPNEVKEYVYKWLNGANDNYATDVVFDINNIKSDNKRIGIFAVTDEMAFPEEISYIKKDEQYSQSAQGFVFYQGLMDDFGITLGIDHIYNQIIVIEDTAKYINQIHSTKDNLYRARKFGHDNILGAERLEAYLKDLRDGNDGFRLVKGHTNIIFFANDEKEFEANKRIINARFKDRGIDIVPYCPTNERLANLYLNSLFVNVPVLDSKSYYLIDLKVATCLFGMNGVYKDDNTGIYFNDRLFNKPTLFDFWDANKRRLTSRNMGLFAPTGRGKSVLTNAIQTGLIDTQNVICVNIDLGRSYEKLAMLYPKEDVGYFRYEEGVPLGLNPFILDEDENVVGELKVDEISEIVWVIIKKYEAPSETEKTSMRKIVDAYYTVMIADKKKAELSWQTFYDFIKSNGARLLTTLEIEPEYFNIKEFIHAGSEFVKGGVYQNVFMANPNTPSHSFRNKKLIVFELDEIKDNAVLLSLMLQIISETIAKVIWKDKSKRGLIVFDEFAKTLQFPGIMPRVAYYAQAIRKQNGGLVLILQNANQFPDTEDGRSVMGNLETVILLPTDDIKVVESLAERKSLSAHDIVQIKSMKHNFSGERKFSEFFMKRGGGFSQVFRLELAPEVLFAYETEGDRAEIIMALYKEYGCMEKTITTYMANDDKFMSLYEKHKDVTQTVKMFINDNKNEK